MSLFKYFLNSNKGCILDQSSTLLRLWKVRTKHITFFQKVSIILTSVTKKILPSKSDQHGKLEKYLEKLNNQGKAGKLGNFFENQSA